MLIKWPSQTHRHELQRREFNTLACPVAENSVLVCSLRVKKSKCWFRFCNAACFLEVFRNAANLSTYHELEYPMTVLVRLHPVFHYPKVTIDMLELCPFWFVSSGSCSSSLFLTFCEILEHFLGLFIDSFKVF